VKTKGTPENPASPNGRRSAGANRPSFAVRTLPKTVAEQKAHRIRLYLAKLGIKPSALQRAAPMTAILAQAEGGLPAILQAMRFASDVPIIARFLKAYDGATSMDRELLPLEAFALAAGIEIPALLGDILVALQRASANLVKVIALSAHPKLVRTRVAQALTPGGVADRNALDKALRFLPTPKGMTIVMAPDTHAEASGVAPDDVDTDLVFPDLKHTQRLLESGDE